MSEKLYVVDQFYPGDFAQILTGVYNIKGHITKHGPSMLRFILVTAAHIIIKYSKRMKAKYLSIVRRLGKNRAIVAIARILLECIYVMLTKNKEL